MGFDSPLAAASVPVGVIETHYTLMIERALERRQEDRVDLECIDPRRGRDGVTHQDSPQELAEFTNARGRKRGLDPRKGSFGTRGEGKPGC
jgi:hypothetical protein